jgi:hypothetical protein
VTSIVAWRTAGTIPSLLLRAARSMVQIPGSIGFILGALCNGTSVSVSIGMRGTEWSFGARILAFYALIVISIRHAHSKWVKYSSRLGFSGSLRV